MRPHIILPFFLQWLLPVQAQPISNPIPKDQPATQDSKGNVPWPVWAVGIPLAGWTIRQAYRHMSRRHPSPWDFYESVDEVWGSLRDDKERYRAETRRCVNEKVYMRCSWQAMAYHLMECQLYSSMRSSLVEDSY